MIILHIAPINMTRANGFRFSVPGLVSAQSKISGIRPALLNVNDTRQLDEEEVESFDFDFISEYKPIDELDEPYNNPDIVVFHGVYITKYIHIYRKLLKRNIPYIIVPRASLTLGAQKQKRLKKIVGNVLLFNRFINNACSIHYLTNNEMKLSSAFRQKHFIVGNGVHIPQAYAKKTDKGSNITFIGRYDINHKGLDILMESLHHVKKELNQYNPSIRLFGSDYNGGQNYLENKISEYGLEGICTVHSPVFGEAKHKVLMDTDIFISPSRFEGHPMAVIEAMAYGIPCILTDGTNMLDVLERYDAGWTATLDARDLARVILSAVGDKDAIYAKGQNARRLAEENYSWEQIAEQTVGYYSQLLEIDIAH